MSLTSLIQPNLRALEQGVDLLRSLPDGAYPEPASGDGLPAVGPHFRHCIDFYRCFLDGFERSEIDYDARSRREKLEIERQLALDELAALVAELDAIAGATDRPVRVRTHGGWSGSTVHRELGVLLSHTIHHYALIALALRFRGHDVPTEFGVAPSTLQYWREEGRCAL